MTTIDDIEISTSAINNMYKANGNGSAVSHFLFLVCLTKLLISISGFNYHHGTKFMSKQSFYFWIWSFLLLFCCKNDISSLQVYEGFVAAGIHRDFFFLH